MIGLAYMVGGIYNESSTKMSIFAKKGGGSLGGFLFSSSSRDDNAHGTDIVDFPT